MKIIELTFQYSQREYVKAERQYLLANKTITKARMIVAILYLLFSLSYFFLSPFSTLSILFLAVALFYWMVGCALYFYIPIRRFQQMSKYHEKYCLTFSLEGIKFITPTINSELKWNIYSDFWESNDFYFLIQAPQMYTLIPKRGFPNSTSKQIFEEIVLTSLKCTKRTI